MHVRMYNYAWYRWLLILSLPPIYTLVPNQIASQNSCASVSKKHKRRTRKESNRPHDRVTPYLEFPFCHWSNQCS